MNEVKQCANPNPHEEHAWHGGEDIYQCEGIHIRTYIDPPVVHLEQVIWCSIHLPEEKVEAVTIKNGNAVCEVCLYRT